MPELNLHARLQRTPDLVAVDMDGDLVMMNIASGQYFGLSGVGLRVWELLETPRGLAELVQAIQAEYEVDEQTCRNDLLAFVESLLNSGVAQQCD